MSFAKTIIKLFLILMPWNLFSQGISNLWLMGYDSGSPLPWFGGTNINFMSGYADTSSVNRPMNMMDCVANISDSSGNLLFYTNGIYIANANNDTMLNGDSLNPSDYTDQHTHMGSRVWQGTLILPMPGSSNLYYLFHETMYHLTTVGDYRPLEIYYSVIDMNLDGGLGAVVQKNVVLLSDTLSIGGITACKHANGRDWWIVFHRYSGNRYYEYLFTPAGLQGPFVQDVGSDINNKWSWQSCFSPDGKKFAAFLVDDTLDIFDFDRCSGLFTSKTAIYINDSASSRGVAFSSTSKYLYASSSKYVYQFDTDSPIIDSSKITVAIYDGFADPGIPFRSAFFLAQLAIDNKIYICTGNGTESMHVINNPDSNGLSCNLIQHSLLLPTANANSIPNFPNYFLGADSGSICDTVMKITRPLDFHCFNYLQNKNANDKTIEFKPLYTKLIFTDEYYFNSTDFFEKNGGKNKSISIFSEMHFNFLISPDLEHKINQNKK